MAVENYSNEQIYNADEAAFYIKMLPKRTLALNSEKVASGRKINKTRLTFMPCANRSGSHKLKMMLIGTAAKPRCFPVDQASLQIYYSFNKNAWMTRVLFASWFNNEFVPSVRTFSIQQGIEPKALLLLDNCSGHHVGCELLSDDGLIKCAFLPPNVTSLGQPMDQGVIAAIKMRYKKKFLNQLLLLEDENSSFEERQKKVTLLHCVNWLRESWDELSAETIKNSWNKIFDLDEIDEEWLEEELQTMKETFDDLINTSSSNDEFKNWTFDKLHRRRG